MTNDDYNIVLIYKKYDMIIDKIFVLVLSLDARGKFMINSSNSVF